MSHLSLCKLPPEKRIQAWVEWLGRSVGAYDTSTVAQGRKGFEISGKMHELGGVIRSRSIGQFYLSKVSANGHSVGMRIRDRRGLQAHMLCVAQSRGQTTFENDGDSITIGAGEIAFFPVRSELKIISPSFFEHCILRSQDDTLWKTVGVQENLHLSGRSPLQRLLGDFLQSLVNEPVFSSPHHDLSLWEAICRLVGFAVKEDDQKSIHCVESGHPLRVDVLRHIEANLHDHNLTASKVAQALGCSRRSIYRILDGEEPLSSQIWRRRVERCALAIKSGRDYGTLTNLAFSFGFNSSSHFCRLFKKHMGVNPLVYACQHAVKRRRQSD